jgi:hypothetical protein
MASVREAHAFVSVLRRTVMRQSVNVETPVVNVQLPASKIQVEWFVFFFPMNLRVVVKMQRRRGGSTMFGA